MLYAMFGFSSVLVLFTLIYYLVQDQLRLRSRQDLLGVETDIFIVASFAVMAAFVIWALDHLRHRFRELHAHWLSVGSADSAFFQLKLRTLLLKGAEIVDWKGDQLVHAFEQSSAAQDGPNHRILQIAVAPDLRDPFKEVSNEKQAELKKALYQDVPLSKLGNKLFPGDVKDEEKYRAKREETATKVHNMLEADIQKSGYAFICFDSFESLHAFREWVDP